MREASNPEQIFISDFKGMATSGGQYAADPRYMNYLVNATVTKDGRLRRRQGSRFFLGYPSGTLQAECYQFFFGGYQWLLVRESGINFQLFRMITGSFPRVESVTYKPNVLSTRSTNEPATYATMNQGRYCHVFVATASSQLISFTIVRTESTVITGNATLFTFQQPQFFDGNVANTSNTRVFRSSDGLNLMTPTSLVGQATNIITITTTLANQVSPGTKVSMFTCFWIRYCDANQYPGVSFWNTALRRNTVTLDVNVELPEPVWQNYIYNEPTQETTIETLRVFTQNNASSSPLTFTNNPTTATTWDFSDGSYRPGITSTNRTPRFVTMGALEPANVNTRLFVARLRNVLVAQGETPTISEISVFADKQTPASLRWHNSTGATIASGFPRFISFMGVPGSVAPGVRQDSVVEVILNTNAAGTASVNNVVDIDPGNERLFINDGWIAPLYGYSLIAKSKSFSFPPVVRVVGNRLVLGGNNGSVLVSQSDWNWRGLTHNNMQVSSLDYKESSPYLVNINAATQVIGLDSVNGIMIVATDDGVYRISGKERTSVPNAITAFVARLSSRRIPNSSCLLVADNSVYFTNNDGLFRLEYRKDIEETATEEMSLPVANLFNTQSPVRLSFSQVLYSLVVEFNQQKQKMLRLDLNTFSYSWLQVSLQNVMRLQFNLDGYLLESSGGFALGSWDNQATQDLENIETVAPFFNYLANTATISTAPTSTFAFATPPELMQSIASSGQVVSDYGYLVARGVGSSAVVTETNNSNLPKPIYSAFVTKALFSDKLTRALRVRSLSYIVTGTGTFDITVCSTKNIGERSSKVVRTTIATNGLVTMANAHAASSLGRFYTGDSVAIKYPMFENVEAFALAATIGQGHEVSGFAFDLSSKQNRAT